MNTSGTQNKKWNETEIINIKKKQKNKFGFLKST